MADSRRFKDVKVSKSSVGVASVGALSVRAAPCSPVGEAVDSMRCPDSARRPWRPLLWNYSLRERQGFPKDRTDVAVLICSHNVYYVKSQNSPSQGLCRKSAFAVF